MGSGADQLELGAELLARWIAAGQIPSTSMVAEELGTAIADLLDAIGDAPAAQQ